MDAKVFFEAFLQELDKQKDACIRDYNDGRAFTKAIILLVKDVLKPKGSEGIGLSCEYYRIDVTSWKDRAAEIRHDAPKNFTPYFWDLEVAVEHENYDRHWMDEVIKLAHINCPLRVVIGYLPVGTNHSNYIAYVSAALKMLRCKQVSDNEFLLLIGNSKVKSGEECFNYQPYLFDGNAFELQASWLQKE